MYQKYYRNQLYHLNIFKIKQFSQGFLGNLVTHPRRVKAVKAFSWNPANLSPVDWNTWFKLSEGPAVASQSRWRSKTTVTTSQANTIAAFLFKEKQGNDQHPGIPFIQNGKDLSATQPEIDLPPKHFLHDPTRHWCSQQLFLRCCKALLINSNLYTELVRAVAKIYTQQFRWLPHILNNRKS